jgi:hypothetical protein
MQGMDFVAVDAKVQRTLEDVRIPIFVKLIAK